MKLAPVVRHLPLLISTAIVAVFSLDLELFAPLKTESTYGLWVVVGVPAAALLLVAQVALWVTGIGARKRPHVQG